MNKQERYIQRRKRTAARIKYSGRARLSVFRSNKEIYAQVIDDTLGKTLASASSKDKAVKAKGKTEAAMVVGELIAEKALKAKVKKIVFDKGGYRYHGRVKALAEGARKGGLEF
jgi:large subunit ribosomal protein L18